MNSIRHFIIITLLVLISACQTKSVSIENIPKSKQIVVKEVVKLARNENIPICLALAVAEQETNSQCGRIGAAGEIGPLQIKYQTARGIGYKGTRNQLKNNCKLAMYWGVRHLSIAYNKRQSVIGAAYLHNAGLYASGKSNNYSRSVNSKYEMCKKYMKPIRISGKRNQEFNSR